MENWNTSLDNISTSALSPSKTRPELHPPSRTSLKNVNKNNGNTTSSTTKTRSPKPTLKIGKLNINTSSAVAPVSPPPPSVAEIINRSAKYLLQNNNESCSIEHNGNYETSFGVEYVGPAVAVIASSPEEYLQRNNNNNNNNNSATTTTTYHHHHHFHYDPSASPQATIVRNLSNNLLASPPVLPPVIEMRQNQEDTEFWDEEVSPESPRNAKECIPRPSPFKQQQQQQQGLNDHYYSRNETNNNNNHEDVAVNLFSSLKTSNTSSPPSQLHQQYSQNYYEDVNNNNNDEHYQEYVVMPKPASGRFRHQNSNYQTTGSSSTIARSPSIGEHQQQHNDYNHHNNININENLFLHSSQKRPSSSSAAAKQPPSKPAAIVSLFQHFGGRVKYSNMKDVLFCASLIKKKKNIGNVPLHLLQSSQEDDDLWCELVDGLAVPYITESRFVEVLLKRRARVIHPADWPLVNINQYSSSRRAASSPSSSQNNEKNNIISNNNNNNGAEETMTAKNVETTSVKPKKKKSTNKPVSEPQQIEREPSPSSSLAYAREERKKTKKSSQKQGEAKSSTIEEQEKNQIVFDDSYVAHLDSQQRDENQLSLEQEQDSSFTFQRQNTHHAAANCPFGIVSKNDLPPMAPLPPTSSNNNNSKQMQNQQYRPQHQPSPSPIPNDPFTSSAHPMTSTTSTFECPNSRDQTDCTSSNNRAFTRMSNAKHTSVEVENEPFENNDGSDSCSSPTNQKHEEKSFSASHSPTNNNLMAAQQNQNDNNASPSSSQRRRKVRNVNSELENAATMTTTTQHLLRASYDSTPLSSSISINNNNSNTPRTNKAAEARRVRSTERRLRVEKLESERHSTNFKPMINNRSRSLSATIEHTTARSQSATHKTGTSSNVAALRSASATSVSSSVRRETKVSSVNRRTATPANNNNNTLSPHAREPSRRTEQKIQQTGSQPKRSLSASSAQNKNVHPRQEKYQSEKEKSRGRSLSTEVRRQMADDAHCTFAPKINKFKYADEKIAALHYRNSEQYVESKLSKTQEQFVSGKYSPMKIQQNKSSADDQQRRQKQRTEIHRHYASSYNSDKTVLPNEYFETVDRLRRNVQLHKDSPDRFGGSFMEKLREGKQKASYATNQKRSLAVATKAATITAKKVTSNSENSLNNNNTSYSYADKWARQVLANATKSF